MFKKNRKYKKFESKEARFKRIASRRVQRILHNLRLLGNCANTSVYSYTDQDKRKIFLVIDNEFKRVKALFNHPKSKKNKFAL